MSSLPIRCREASRSGNSSQYGIPNTGASHTVSNRIHGDRNTNVGNLSNFYNNTINVGPSEEALRIQAWLSPLEPQRRHRDVSNRRLDGVGDWVLERNEFERWYKSRGGTGNPTLLCYGGQGVGKTYISSLVIDTLCEQACGQNVAVLFLYCDYQAQKDQSAVNMIGSLLSQVALGATQIPADIQRTFEVKEKGSKGLRLPDMVKLLVKTINCMEQAYICLDAVDELRPQNRSELLRALRQIIQDAPNTRLFLTGRPHIRGELDKHLTKEAYTVHIFVNQGDIARYMSQKMDEADDRDPDLMPDDLRNDIETTITGKASEMFLLAALNIGAILGETTVARRKKMLQRVATTGVDLDTVYAQTLQRIRDQPGGRSRLGMEVLMWASHAEQPLRVDELRHALAVDMESTDLDVENICSVDTVLGSCLGLVVVDQETLIVRLIHFTLQEYLSLPGILPDAHKTLGYACLTYLNYRQVKRLTADSAPNLRYMPFLEYSSLHWGCHAKLGFSDCVESLTLELLKFYQNHISATILLSHLRTSHSPPELPSLFTGLHCACYFGIVQVVEALIEMGACGINQRDRAGFTPIMWASRQGNGEVVRLLLEKDDVSPATPDCYGRTPLSVASEGGHEEVVKLLLARDDVNPDKLDNSGNTSLLLASMGGHKGVVGQLLARGDVDPNNRDHFGQTSLLIASSRGYEGVVRLLLARNDLNPDQPDNYGHTPLLLASMGGREGVVRLLLTRANVNPNKADREGQTPLLKASFGGHVGVVRLLLSRDDINPHKPASGGVTPLSFASAMGYREILALLLPQAATNSRMS